MEQRIPVALGNVTPLSLRPSRPRRIALMCEGGGQRGTFTTGALDEFMRTQFNPFDFYLGISAEAQNLSAFICNRPGYVRKVIMRYATKREFFDPSRLVRGGNLIDLDWLMETIASQMPLQTDTAAQLFDSGKSFYMCACHQDNYAPSYFLPTKQNWLDVVRASSAIPGFYHGEVSLEGISYLGSGISDAIPVKGAARQDAKTLVVIRTTPSQVYHTPQWFKRMEHWLGDSSLQPLVDLVQHHETNYHDIQQFIGKPPGKLRIFEIYPSKPLHSIALGSRVPALREGYKLRRSCGRYFLAMVGKLLTERAPLTHRLVPVMTPESIVVPPAPVADDTLVAEVIDVPQVDDPAFSNEDLV